jgi:hypothetical protein
MSLGDYAEALLLDALLAEMPFEVALSTADPGEDGATIAEPSGNGYARVSSSDFARTTSTVSNDANITFATASGSWGTITHFALFDGSANFLGSGELGSSQAIGTGDTAQFDTGDMSITLT